MAISDFSNEDIINIAEKCNTKIELAKALGYSHDGGTVNQIINKKLKQLNYDFVSKKSNTNKRYTDEEVFSQNSSISSHSVRERYKKKYPPEKCAICNNKPIWQGKPLELRLDHINGDHFDNRLINLRWICPNCDSQLETYCGRNKKKNIKIKNYCIDCGKEISIKSVRCLECSSNFISQTNKKLREEIISREELKKLIRTVPFTKIGEQYNVTDNAIRKWCDRYNLPRTKKEINAYSDIEWEQV